MDLKDKNVLVCGIGKSGISASVLLKKLGAVVTIQDLKEKSEITNLAILEENEIKLYLGKNPDVNIIDETDLMVLSPGLPLDLDFILYASKRLKIIGEIELAYLNCSAEKIIAITGTNGKTTTTSLIGEIIGGFRKTHIVGNIGVPFSEKVAEISKDDFVVAEVSSFQLETISKFKPKVACVLNITPDHLNRHKTMENYISIKENIFKNQTEDDFLILNYDDLTCRKMKKKAKSKILYFSTDKKIKNGAYLLNENIYIECFGHSEALININDLKILGKHNIENAMAAVLTALALNVSLEIIKKGLIDFKAVEHRIEYVCSKKGVDYFNDSKGTNTDSGIKAIQSMKKPIYLIAGGYDKGTDFIEWIKSFENKVKKLILIGQVKEQIAKDCDKLLFYNYELASTLEEAVKICYNDAKPSDCVLLSPACASWDMFKDYEERGNLFKKCVNDLEE